jgi:hypothetical protein
MPIITPVEGDYQVIMDILADLPEHAITEAARLALDGAQRTTRVPGGAMRIIDLPSAADSASLRGMLQDFLHHSGPMGARKHALQRLIPLLTAAR